jgi:5-(carboxyamino)imidazole ribonucleotide synthase
MNQAITSTFKLGILGGGQLGKMLTIAASNWDVNTYVLDPNNECSAATTCSKYVQGDFTNYEDVYNFGKGVDLITIEIENVNIDALKQLKAEGKTVYPDPQILEIIKDKGLQKTFYKEHNIPSSEFELFNDEQAIKDAVQKGDLTIPFVQKSRSEGYDGKGVKVVTTLDDLNELLPGPSLAEKKVQIKKELSVIVARNPSGDIKCFPIVEMEFNHEANLVEYLLCPAEVSNEIAEEAKELAIKLVKAMEFEGLLAVEMFLDTDGNILINEVAPRPHNSGHHTIESAFTSQYEQHLRAILDFPLGATEAKIPSIMLNVLGEPGYEGEVKLSGLKECMSCEGVKLHMYGKKITKPFRKMGHITILDKDIEQAKQKAKYIKENFKVIA